MSAATTPQVPAVRLGKSGLKISKIVLGCMSYGSSEWQPWVLGQKEATEHVKACMDVGINTFDTANVYSNGESERVLGNAIKELKLKREDIVVLTKCYMAVHDSPNVPVGTPVKPNQSGLSRKHIFASIKDSLARLQLDYVDMLQCHRFDYDTPIEETMEALHDVVKAGYARYIGMSSCYAYQFQQMQQYAIQKNLTPFISMQNFYNAAYREEEREMMPTLQQFGVGAIPWSPLNRGFLSRPAGEQTTRSSTDRNFKNFTGETSEGSPSYSINKAIEQIANKRGVTMAQISLAWVMSKPYVSAPIIGSTKLENILDLVKAVEIKLTEEEIKAIEEPYRPRGILGHS